MLWVTRTRPITDQLAAAWLIRTFIDASAAFLCVPPDTVAAVATARLATSFGTPGASYGPRAGGGRCTVEALIEAYALGDDAALVELARIVRAAVTTDVTTHPFARALRAIGDSASIAEPDDQRLLTRSGFAFDALYAHCLRSTASTRPAP